MFDRPATPTLSAHVRRGLGQRLAALYDGLPIPPPGPELRALLRRLAEREAATPPAERAEGGDRR